MRTREEIVEKLETTRAWLEEYEGSGVSEEGVETGREQALAWVLEEAP